MKIGRPKDFWAGLLFITAGLFFALWALEFYEIGTAIRMGSGYFPTTLGFLLAALGAVILFQSLGSAGVADGASLYVPFNIIDLILVLAVFGVAIWLSRVADIWSGYAIVGATVIVALLTFWRRPGAKALVMVTAALIGYGYLMHPLGLLLATGALVFTAAAGGHEFKWKEVIVLFVVLVVFSMLVFVKGLTLTFPICPDVIEHCPIR